MTTKCRNCPLQSRSMFKAMTKDELEYMQKFKVGELMVEPGAPILMEGSNAPQLYTALSGMGIRETTIANGERQVISFVFPGDFIGLQAGVFGEMGHSVEARTHMRLCVFDRSEFWQFFRAHPARAFDITWLAAVEEHFLGQTLATVGQRSATEAIAWALIKIFVRGKELGMVHNNLMSFPFTQRDLADTLGLSLVHTNKTLAKLKKQQLVSWSDGNLKVNDIEELARIGVTTAQEPSPRPLM